MSVDITISITSARSSLHRSQGGPTHFIESSARVPRFAPTGVRFLPPVVLVEVDQDVGVLLRHQPVGGAHVVVLQDRAIVVQDGHLRPDAAHASGHVTAKGGPRGKGASYLVWVWKLFVVPVCSKS